MTIRRQHGKRQLCFHAVLVFALLAVIFTTAHTAAGISGDQTGKFKVEFRLASNQKVEGWERVAGPGPAHAPVWISPEAALSNRDVARAFPDRTADGKPCIGVWLTEDGALKVARLTRSHIGEVLAIMLDGRITAAPVIREVITGGRAQIHGDFTEETVSLWAKRLSSGKSVKIKFQLRLASHKKVDGWERVPGPYWTKTDIWISPVATLTNADLTRAWPQADVDRFNVGFLLTEEGALKLARLTKSHVGETVVLMIDGRVVSTPKILAEISGGRAVMHLGLNEEEAKWIAEGIMVK